MNKPAKNNDNIGNNKDADPNPLEKQDDSKRTPEDAIKEPSTPVPATDDINPPLEATLGGDDLVIPTVNK